MEKDVKNDGGLQLLLDSIREIEERIQFIDVSFLKRIADMDTKFGELEDLTKEFLGEDEEEDLDLAGSGTATPAWDPEKEKSLKSMAAGAIPENGELVEELLKEEEDFFKAAEKRKDEAKHALYCPYVEEYNDPRGFTILRTQDLSKLRRFAYLRQYIYWTMHDESFSILSYLVFLTVMLLILVSTLAYVLATMPDYEDWDGWKPLETVVSVAFTVEYVIRMLVVRDRLNYFIDIMNFIDFLAVVPFWFEMVVKKDGAFLRTMRVVRLARISRLRTSGSVSEYIEVMKTTLEKTFKESFGMLVSLLFLEVVVFSSLIYVFEKGSEHPTQVDGAFGSIPSAMWWCVVTITTVGYGDMYPVTIEGKIVGCITTFTGLVVMAIFVIIIGGNFEKIYKEFLRRKRKHTKLKKIKKEILHSRNQSRTHSRNPSLSVAQDGPPLT